MPEPITAKKPQAQSTITPANNLSLAGKGLLERREAARDYYDDIAGNCTKGIGVLVHRGHCTADELKAKLSADERSKSFSSAIDSAVRTVEQQTKKQNLSQEQFDALVSFTYNVGSRGARKVLQDVNEGKFKTAAIRMQKYDSYTPMDKNGKPLLDKNGKRISKTSRGLAKRRLEESRAFSSGASEKEPQLK